MGKGRDPDPPCFRKYGLPFYSASWVPSKKIFAQKLKQKQESQKEGEEVATDDGSTLTSDTKANRSYLAFAGGGGEGRSGIPNAILLADFDFSSNSLSEQPVAKLGTQADLPYRMAVHPGGEGLICSLPKSCRWFKWDVLEDEGTCKLDLISSEKVLTQLEDIGQQLALTFNSEGSVLAVGGEDGYLRVFKWPSMEVILEKDDAYSSVKDLDFSSDGKLLVSLGNGGPCRVWDVTLSTVIASLPKESDEVFGFCRFSQTSDNKQILYTTAMRDRGGSIVSWNTSSWRRVRSKQIVRDPICAFDVSADGRLLAVGTVQGDVFIINSLNMKVQTVVRKAHLGLVTRLTFSEHSRALASTSMDSSVRVTVIGDQKRESGGSVWIIIFVVLFAILVYFLKTYGAIPHL
ncbi:SEC12-like protein 2 [Macadamia integrifolia]|uniref:SEC12-like protein 2 n=1 Tax=Macadamia integrifolia TaxID=60698 RepID=UPI001C4F19F8|nr:SEC12-like protein 2 [Macadamia integrifolia]